MRQLLIVGLLIAVAAPCGAQTLTGDRVRLSAGPCVVTSQAGPPIEVIFSGSCSGLTTSAATNLTLHPTGDLITNPAGKDILPGSNYDINIGMLSNKYLTLHAAELWVETLVAQNTIATIGGRVLVAPTNTLTLDLAPATTTISVKYNNFSNGDRVYMEANGSLEFMAVTSSASGGGPYTYTVTRNLDGSGANQWYAGDAIVDTGTTGNGFIDLYSTAGILSSGSGPSIVGNVRTGTTYNAYAPRWAIGNLNGLYGYGATTYGAVFGDPSATNVTVDATNGFRIRSSTTNKFVADTSGNLSIVGDLSVGTSGVIRSNATGFSTGTGYWLDYNGGTPRFRIGNPAGNQLTWDGTTLSVTGAITAQSGTIGSFTIGTYLYSGSKTAYNDGLAGVHLGSDGIGLGSAFTVSAAGALTASSASITGSVTATSGAIGACTISSTQLVCGGTVTLDGSGITIANGSGYINQLNWNDGSNLRSASGLLIAQGSQFLVQVGGCCQYDFTSSSFSGPGGSTLGNGSSLWSEIWVGNDYHWNSPPFTTSNDAPVVYSSGNSKMYVKTNGYSGTCNSPSTVVIELGIVVDCF